MTDTEVLIDALFEADNYIIRPCHKCNKNKPYPEMEGKLMFCNMCSKWHYDNEVIAAPSHKSLAGQTEVVMVAETVEIPGDLALEAEVVVAEEVASIIGCLVSSE